jgi:hypothetical protein
MGNGRRQEFTGETLDCAGAGGESEDVHGHGIDRTVGTIAGRCWSAGDRNFGPCGEENNLRFEIEQ